jgi:hypothetical protein
MRSRKKSEAAHLKKKEIKEARKFFCSELVAKAFKQCGLMKNDEDSCQNYKPTHFSGERFTIPLLKDVRIGHEKGILIEKRED